MTAQQTRQYKILQIYSLCLDTIKTMPSLEAKRFCAQIATMVYPFINSMETNPLNQCYVPD